MDNNAALRRLYGQFHVHAVDMPSPAEAVTILDQYKETMRALGIKSPKFKEVLFDPIRRRFSIIARREIEEEVTHPLLEILRDFSCTGNGGGGGGDNNDDDHENNKLEVITYARSFIPEVFLKCQASGVYTGLMDDDGTSFTYASILRHFGCSNRHFKSFLASTLGCEVLVGTSWDAKILYVGAPDDETVEIVIDVFHGLRVQMMRDLVNRQSLSQIEWDFARGQESTAMVLRDWVSGLGDAEEPSSGPSDEEMAGLWEAKQEDEDLIQLV